jgi:myo-inositol catabolism protein IolC
MNAHTTKRPGYPGPLYLLPFDHRHSYVSEMFGFEPPLTREQRDAVVDSKQLIYEGFVAAVAAGLSARDAGILVDEEFGTAILRDAARRRFVTAVSTERSGIDEYEFEYGDHWREHLLAFAPTFAKALVRYNPDGDAALNRRQAGRLAALSDNCRRVVADTGRQRFMFELLVPPTPAQLQCAGGDREVFDREVRPALMIRAIHALQDAGVEPDVWKIEGLATVGDAEKLVAAARRDGRDGVSCIVLGRGADDAGVEAWLKIAASVSGFIGFAIGRTTFWDAVAADRAQTSSRAAAVATIATKLRTWVDVFERARADGRDRSSRGLSR